MAEFTVEVDAVDGGSAVFLRCRGDIDAHTCDELEKAVDGTLDGGVTRVIVDLTHVGYTSSRGLGVLIRARTLTAAGGGRLVLVNPNDVVRAAIDVLGFNAVFDIAASDQEALALLSA